MKHPHTHNPGHTLLSHLERTLGAGILVTLPIGITLLILKFIFDLLDPLLQDMVLQFLPVPQIPGLGLVGLIILVYLSGIVTTYVVGRRFINLGHKVMEFIPLVKSIYGTARIGIRMFSDTKTQPYTGVVLVEFPHPGMKSIGLVTANLGIMDGKSQLVVFVPSTPIPTSGYLVVVPTKDVTQTNMSVEEAMKIIVSGGILVGNAFGSSPPPQDG
jgi:uncharacterized membrane protein